MLHLLYCMFYVVSWLMSDPAMRVRSSYKPYLEAVEKYFDKLLPLVHDLQVETSTACETLFYNIISEIITYFGGNIYE